MINGTYILPRIKREQKIIWLLHFTNTIEKLKKKVAKENRGRAFI